MSGSKNPERLIFHDDLSAWKLATDHERKPFVRDGRGWCLFGAQDVRNSVRQYTFCLMKLPRHKTVRVRVGCRYFTLQQAWKHWGVIRRRDGTSRRNQKRQAVAIIRLMLVQAQAWGLLSAYRSPLRFDSTIIKPKRK